MTMITITIGWWAAPSIVTALAWLWTVFKFEKDAGPYGAGAFVNLFYAMEAVIITLLAWLIFFMVI